MRLLPDFIIIGSQKCGTTSLYRYLSGHPLLEPSLWKEVHYFDLNYEKGTSWYRAQFPLAAHKGYATQVKKEQFITGEASPYYMFQPHVPKRVAELVPQVKLIVLLRNPVDRTYSHYYHEVKNKRDPLSFGEAIETEAEHLAGELAKMLADEHYYSYNHHRFSYLARGIYLEQLLAWEKFFDRSQFLIINSEEFFTDPTPSFARVLDFLGLPPWYPAEFKQHNVNDYPEIDPVIRQQLQAYFEPYNQRLYQHLGIEFEW